MKKSIFFALFLSSCWLQPIKISEDDAKDFAESTTYCYDKTADVCFAYIGAREWRNRFSSIGFAMTVVPREVCEKHGLLEGKNE